MSVRDVLRDTTAPVDWDRLPDLLEQADLARVLRVGREAAYAWMRQHPGLVVKAGHSQRVPREGLRRFLARDPAVLRIAYTDPYGHCTEAAIPRSLLRVAE
ncbi:MAG: hypothetical protein ACO1SX_13050 [Actinomycetota bacterium]